MAVATPTTAQFLDAAALMAVGPGVAMFMDSMVGIPDPAGTGAGAIPGRMTAVNDEIKITIPIVSQETTNGNHSVSILQIILPNLLSMA
jgi:hypothetical protein